MTGTGGGGEGSSRANDHALPDVGVRPRVLEVRVDPISVVRDEHLGLGENPETKVIFHVPAGRLDPNPDLVRLHRVDLDVVGFREPPVAGERIIVDHLVDTVRVDRDRQPTGAAELDLKPKCGHRAARKRTDQRRNICHGSTRMAALAEGSAGGKREQNDVEDTVHGRRRRCLPSSRWCLTGRRS